MKCSDISLQKVLDLAVSEGFLTFNASKTGIEHSKGFLFSEENSSFLKSFKNKDLAVDLGTGGGFPGIIIAIIAKNMRKKTRIKLYEKSYHKAAFLKEVSKKLDLNTEVYQEDIFKIKNIKVGSILARAFKPLPVILDLVTNNFLSYKNLIIFMGKSGGNILEENLKKYDLSFEKKNSITSKNSFLLNITNIKRIN